MTAVYPSGTNTYVPELTDRLVVDYSRNIKKFPLNQYVQIVPVELNKGYYLRMTREEAGRVMNTDGRDFMWPDGNDRPEHNNELESHDFVPYLTYRRDFGFNVGYLASQQASWNLKQRNAKNKAEQAMRVRTQLVISAATTSGNYDASHVSAVSGGSITGTTGKWDDSTTARKDIKRSLDYAAEKIITDSLNGVEPEDLMLVVSMGAARKMSVSQEIVDYIKGSPAALAELRGETPGRNSYFGLPNKLYGYDIVIENTVKTTTRKGAATTTKSPILPDSTPFMCSRVGSLVSEGGDGAPNFSSYVLFMKEEMTVEEFDEPKHRKISCHVAEDYVAAVVAPITAFLFTGATN